jgi:thiamine-monophosphate kinase
MPSRPSPFGKSRLSEFRLIKTLCRRFGQTGPRVLCGIGDDTAVVRPNAGGSLLLTTDLLAEGIHFRRDTATFEDIGYRAAVANLSDIAAMGGTPQYMLVALAIPPNCTGTNIEQLYKGLMKASRPHGVELVGGDTSASAQGLFITITMTGHAARERVLTRSSARVGDLIFVTGTLGDSLAGLQLLLNDRGAAGVAPRDRIYLVGRHRRPTPRVVEGRILARHGLATAAIDLSDGLSGDLAHVCEQSGVGAEIHTAALPLSSACLAYASAQALDPIDLALQGGEDYELLFTVSPRKQARVERLARRVDCRWSCIGVIRPESFGLRLRRPDGTLRRLQITSYQHFGNQGPSDREAACSH